MVGPISKEDREGRLRKLAAGALALLVLAIGLPGRTLRVPDERTSLKAAVFAAQPGDLIEVEDGVYFEENIPITKRLTIRARHPYAAVIYGRTQRQGLSCVFLVQAEADIGGFILKNSGYGILQRSSADVAWSAHDLAILNMSRAAVAVNEKSRTEGRGSVERLLVNNCAIAFQTEDAHSLNIRRCLVANCGTAFSGSNHRSFQAEDVWVWNCANLLEEDSRLPSPGSTNRVHLGRGVQFLPAASFRGMGLLDSEPDIARALDHLQNKSREQGLEQQSSDIVRGVVYWILGDISAKVAKSSQALAYYRRVLEIGRILNFPELVWPAFQGMAAVFQAAGRVSEALAAYRSAIREVENIRQDLVLKLATPGYLADKIKLYESLIGLLYDLHQEHPDSGYAPLAFEYSEQSKARDFIQSLREADQTRSSRTARAFRAQEQEVTHRMEVLQTRLRTPNLDPSRRASLIVELDKAIQDLKSLFYLIREKTPELRNLPPTITSGPEEVRAKLLDDRSLLVEYFLGETRSYAFGLSSKNLIFVRLADSQTISDLTERFLRFLSIRDKRHFAGVAGSRKLYEALLAPFEAQLAGPISRITIVPDGKLFYLPFEALMRTGLPAASGFHSSAAPGGRFLVEDYEVSYAPSASTLMAIQERPRRPPGSLEFLGVASSWKRDRRPIVFPQAGQLPPLEHAEREIETAASCFPKDKVRLLSGESATESDFLKLPLDQFRIIHFAAHGLFDDQNWLRSCLLLEQDSGGEYDGFLQPFNIYQLDLNADLVVLSACDLGLGRLEKGEGLFGMALTFFYAGARSFLCSLWSVNDQDSVLFMKTFYDRLRAGWTSGAALRQAKLDMLRKQGRSPYYWAGFVILCGSDRSRPR